MSKLIGLTLASACLLHCSEPDWGWEHAVGLVTCVPVCIGGLYHWLAVLQSIWCVDKMLAYKVLPNNSFLLPYCMVSIIPVFHLQCHIHVYCLVCVVHMLTLDYWFLCIVHSLCPIAVDLPKFPTNEVLHVLHLSMYIPLEFVLVLAILSVSHWCIVFVACRAVFKLECLKKIVISHISGPWYVNVTHFFAFCVVVVGRFLFFGCQFFLQVVNDRQWKSIVLGYCDMIFHSCCLACFVIGSTSILFM